VKIKKRRYIMRRKIFLIFVGLLFWSSSVLGQDCPPPPRAIYYPDLDSYIVVEGEIKNIPPPCLHAEPPVFENPFSPPEGCEIITYKWRPNQSGSHYCYYWIFKRTATKEECWEYFRSLTSITLEVSYIELDMGQNKPEHRIPHPRSYTVNLGPVQSTH